MTTIYHNATVFTADDPNGTCSTVAQAFAVHKGRFSAVGTTDEVRRLVADEHNADEVDLTGAFVMPGIVESHTHLSMLGQALASVELRDCNSLQEIGQRLIDTLAAQPNTPRLQGNGWLFTAVPDEPTAAMLDAFVADIPVYLNNNDLHSTWLNSAAIRELGITTKTPDPLGGSFSRDSSGRPNGMAYETATTEIVAPFLRSTSTHKEHVRNMERGFEAYLEAGVSRATDMSFNADDMAAINTLLQRDGRLPFPLSAHYIMVPSGNSHTDRAEVARIAKLRDQLAGSPYSDWFRISGVKFIMDGVIDACTATMRSPYADGSNCDPIWDAERITPVAQAADAAGLQFAMHAIGDRTSQIALDAIAHAMRVNGDGGPWAGTQRRHCIEHLESATDATILRMAKLSAIASMQPVHADPAVLENWKVKLGDERAENGFAWQKFRQADVRIALGTDAPTAPHQPLPNLFIALTGGSALQPTLEPYHSERAFTPEQALTALTRGGAYAGHSEQVCGSVKRGLDADFTVIDTNPLEAKPSDLLQAKVLRTYVRGDCKYRASLDAA